MVGVASRTLLRRRAVQFCGFPNVLAQIIVVLGALEIRCVVGVSSALVQRNLRIGAKRAGEGNIAVCRYIIREFGRDDFVRRDTLFDPAINSGDEIVLRILRVARIVRAVENICARSGETMTHTWHHEVAEEVCSLVQCLAITAKVLFGSLRGDDTGVVLVAGFSRPFL